MDLIPITLNLTNITITLAALNYLTVNPPFTLTFLQTFFCPPLTKIISNAKAAPITRSLPS